MSVVLPQMMLKTVRPGPLKCGCAVQSMSVLRAAHEPLPAAGMTSTVLITTRTGAVTRAATARSAAGMGWTVPATKPRSWQRAP